MYAKCTDVKKEYFVNEGDEGKFHKYRIILLHLTC